MSEVKSEPTDTGRRRGYRSPLREQNARRTRRLVADAAGELFVARGYAATSFAEIAAAAGVARPTAFAAFGSKPALLRAVLDHALAGDDDPVPVAQRPWFRPVWDSATPASVLDAYAGVCTLINGRAAALIEVVRRAADESAELAALWQTLIDSRRAGAAMVVRHAATQGPLPAELDLDRATDLLWILTDPALYDSLVTGRGWPPPAYTAWLSRHARHALLAPPEPPSVADAP